MPVESEAFSRRTKPESAFLLQLTSQRMNAEPYGEDPGEVTRSVRQS